jgi:hypothetical protein
LTKPFTRRAGGVTQGVSPESNTQYYKKRGDIMIQKLFLMIHMLIWFYNQCLSGFLFTPSEKM